MATMTTVTMVDDIDGSAATETVSFALDGASYEIDLNDKNAKKLRDAVANFVAHGRRIDGGRRSAGRSHGARGGRSRSRATPDREQTAAVRDWARSQGYEVSDRGRLSAAIMQAFDEAH